MSKKLSKEIEKHMNASGIVAIDINSFVKLDIPPRDCLMSPWLPMGGLTQVYAYRGVGKTYFALSVAFAVSTGKEFLGWQCPEPKRVLYIDGEMPAPDMQNRIKMVSSNSDLSNIPFKLITPDLHFYSSPNLATPEGQAEIETHTNKADLIIVDNISTLCRVGKENDSDSWLEVQRWSLKMRSEGRSVLFVHHANKGGTQRGTSAREDVLDTVIALKKPTGSSPSEGATFEVHFEKSRGFMGDDAKAFIATMTSENGHQNWTKQSLDDNTFNRAIKLSKEGLSGAEIARELDVNRSTISRHLSKAKEQGFIE